MFIIKPSKTIQKVITSRNVETTTTINTINPNETIKKKLTNKKPTKPNPSNVSHNHNKITDNRQNSPMHLRKEVLRKSIGKIGFKLKSMLLINWYLAGNVEENLIRIVFKNISLFAKRSSLKRERSLMLRIRESLQKSRRNS